MQAFEELAGAPFRAAPESVASLGEKRVVSMNAGRKIHNMKREHETSQENEKRLGEG